MSKSVERRLAIQNYYDGHRACPACGIVDGMETTCVGMIDYPETDPRYRDRNRATCSCGWVGIVHDLKPRP